jgi:hypothetical protein
MTIFRELVGVWAQVVQGNLGAKHTAGKPAGGAPTRKKGE